MWKRRPAAVRIRRARAAPALAVLALVPVLVLFSACGRGQRKPANVILFIGDGLSVESEIAASRYLYGRDQALAWQALPGQGYVATWDATAYNQNAKAAGRAPYSDAVFAPSLGYDVRREGRRPFPDEGCAGSERPVPAPATDSAAAATALATGEKTDSGNIAWRSGDKPGGEIATIAEEFRARRGGAIGVVTTVPFDHATPAAFVSHNTGRNHYYTGLKGYEEIGIADEIILRVKPDVVIGGGHPLLDNPAFDTNKGYISEALYKKLQTSTDYVLAERKTGADGSRTLREAAAQAVARGEKLFGLFGGAGGSFALPLPEARPGAPALARETSEDPALKDAVLAALRVLGRNRGGFFLMAEQGEIDWANHDNDFRRMIGAVADLDEAVRSAIAFVDEPGDEIDWTNTVLVVTADHSTGGMRLNPGKPLGAGELPRQIARAREAAPASKSPFHYPDGEVSYATIGHTNELVALAATGAATRFFLQYKGWWYPGPIIDNTQVNAAMRQALGLAPRKKGYGFSESGPALCRNPANSIP